MIRKVTNARSAQNFLTIYSKIDSYSVHDKAVIKLLLKSLGRSPIKSPLKPSVFTIAINTKPDLNGGLETWTLVLITSNGCVTKLAKIPATILAPKLTKEELVVFLFLVSFWSLILNSLDSVWLRINFAF